MPEKVVTIPGTPFLGTLHLYCDNSDCTVRSISVGLQIVTDEPYQSPHGRSTFPCPVCAQPAVVDALVEGELL